MQEEHGVSSPITHYPIAALPNADGVPRRVLKFIADNSTCQRKFLLNEGRRG
jgi:hypothetical protein